VHARSYDGDPRFDVYLSELTREGLYGYCTTDDRRTQKTYQYWDRDSYCTLDDDYVGYRATPEPGNALAVTAAHEFFHAVQSAYDAFEDPWMEEATATWMEDVVYDTVNDNRQYLRSGSLGRPRVPLDTFRSLAGTQYGNWIFFQFFEQYMQDRGWIRNVWEWADGAPGGPDRYSVRAVAASLRQNHSSLGEALGDYTYYNNYPRYYVEGRAYRPAPGSTYRLGAGRTSTGWRTLRMDHLTSAYVRLRPRSGARYGHVLVAVDLPGSAAQARVFVRFRHGSPTTYDVQLDRRGDALVRAGFDRRAVVGVDLLLANTDARYRCWKGTSYACQGVPLGDRHRFSFRATVR
jgi:hypothetical protein